jgi:hypothetical protein
VVLFAHGHTRVPLSQARELVASGEGYATESEAQDAAARWRTRLRFAFAGSLIGADFFTRAPKQHITPHGLDWLREQIRSRNTGPTARLGVLSGYLGRGVEVVAKTLLDAEGLLLAGPQVEGDRVLQDVRGTQVFECEPRPVFASLDFDSLIERSLDLFLQLIAAATAKDVSLNDNEELAFELFSGSFFEPTVDGRLLLLMMAVDARTVQELRAEPLLALLEQFIAATEAAGLAAEESEALVNGLGNLKRESISRAGQRLAETLGGRRYLEELPPQFYKRCYSLRSTLVHGNPPYPSFDEVNTHGGALESFVRDLLTLPLGVDLA